jgi:hypothetical protein
MYVYSYVLIELVLDFAAVLYAYRLTRITGTFKGWVLMIIAVALIAIQGSTSLVETILFFPEAQLEQLINSFGATTIVTGSVLGLAVSLSLFLAMFERFRTFRRLQQSRQT